MVVKSENLPIRSVERGSWSSNDPEGAFASPLKLIMSGRRNYDNGTVERVGDGGYYWSSTVTMGDWTSKRLYFTDFNAYMADGRLGILEHFPLSTGDFIELLEEEILFCVKYEGPLKGSTVN